MTCSRCTSVSNLQKKVVGKSIKHNTVLLHTDLLNLVPKCYN